MHSKKGLREEEQGEEGDSETEFSNFAGILRVASSQHHFLGFEIAQLEFHHLP